MLRDKNRGKSSSLTSLIPMFYNMKDGVWLGSSRGAGNRPLLCAIPRLAWDSTGILSRDLTSQFLAAPIVQTHKGLCYSKEKGK